MKGVGGPLSYTTLQYFRGWGSGVCFAQRKAGITFQTPSTIAKDEGRHWPHGADGNGLGDGDRRRDQQTEQSQLMVWGKRR